MERTSDVVMTILRPLKAIRAKCLDCTCGSRNAVKDCTTTTCSLWPYRLGKRPETAAKQCKQRP